MPSGYSGFAALGPEALGLGCWPLGGGAYWGTLEQVTATRIVRRALDGGIRYFDTAESYNDGASEQALGQALGSDRHRAIIGTKVSPENAQNPGVRAACESSLRRLGTDYIDLYMLHWPLPLSPDPASRHLVEDIWATFLALQDEGKIRAIGLSNHGPQQMRQVQALSVPIISQELPYSLLSRAIECEILPICQQQHYRVIAYSPLQQGLLTGKYASFDAIPPQRARSRHFHWSRGQGQSRHHGSGVEEALEQALETLQTLANDLRISLSQLALAWVRANSAIDLTIVGVRTVEQLEDHLAASAALCPPSIQAQMNAATQGVFDALGCNPDYHEDAVRSRIR